MPCRGAEGPPEPAPPARSRYPNIGGFCRGSGPNTLPRSGNRCGPVARPVRARPGPRGATGSGSMAAIPGTLLCRLRACGPALPDPGGGVRDRMSERIFAPRPAFRARRCHVREEDSGRHRAAATPDRRAEAARTATRRRYSDRCAGLPGAGSGALRIGIALDSSYYRLLSSPKPHCPAWRSGRRPYEPIAAVPWNTPTFRVLQAPSPHPPGMPASRIIALDSCF